MRAAGLERFIKLPPSLLQRTGTFELALHVAGFARPSVSSALDPSFWNWVTRSMHTVSLVFRLPPQCQLVMSFGSAPLALWMATCGYGHIGRLPSVAFVDVIESGALPLSTQFTITSNRFCGCGPAPPPQCVTPGARKKRNHDARFSYPL